MKYFVNIKLSKIISKNMNKYIDYFLNYLQTEKDAAKSTIHKYRADIEKLFNYLQLKLIGSPLQ
jgi:site-specific recombinase XerD